MIWKIKIVGDGSPVPLATAFDFQKPNPIQYGASISAAPYDKIGILREPAEGLPYDECWDFRKDFKLFIVGTTLCGCPQ